AAVTVTNLMRVTSAATRTSWQLEHPIAIAECTDFPLALASWHSRHLLSSVFAESGGCDFACAEAALKHASNNNAADLPMRISSRVRCGRRRSARLLIANRL